MRQQTSAATETGAKGKNIIDFSGKTLHVGIDVHQKDYQVGVLHQGVGLGNHRMPASAAKLIEHFHSRYPGATIRCAYESSAWGFNLQRQLTAAGIECIVVNAADVGTTDKERRRKTDKRDAMKLARDLESNRLEAIHVPDEEIQTQRNLIRYRKKLVGDINRSKNRIKSLLKYQGIDIPEKFSGKSNWSHNFMKWIEQEAGKNPLLQDVLLLMLDQVKGLRGLLLQVERKLKEMMKGARYNDNMKLLTSVVGVGPTTSALFLLEVGDVRRFRGFDRLNNYVGFCPDTYSSGETERDRGITRRRHKQLRTALIEAAWQAKRTDPALLETYLGLIKRMDSNEAIIRIARKLLRRMRAVLISGKPYQKGVIA